MCSSIAIEHMQLLAVHLAPIVKSNGQIGLVRGAVVLVIMVFFF